MPPEIKTLTEEKHIKFLNYQFIVYNLKWVPSLKKELRLKKNVTLKKIHVLFVLEYKIIKNFCQNGSISSCSSNPFYAKHIYWENKKRHSQIKKQNKHKNKSS